MLPELIQSADICLSCFSEFEDIQIARPIWDRPASRVISLRLYSIEK